MSVMMIYFMILLNYDWALSNCDRILNDRYWRWKIVILVNLRLFLSIYNFNLFFLIMLFKARFVLLTIFVVEVKLGKLILFGDKLGRFIMNFSLQLLIDLFSCLTERGF